MNAPTHHTASEYRAAVTHPNQLVKLCLIGAIIALPAAIVGTLILRLTPEDMRGVVGWLYGLTVGCSYGLGLATKRA